MISRLSLLFSLCLLLSCMPEENLPVRNVGEPPEYFIECYCKPGKPFSLSATTVLPVSDNLEMDYSKEMSVLIHTDQDIELYHVLYTLPGSDFIYNYGSKEKLKIIGLDSLHLSIITPDQKYISASTAIPPSISICKYSLQNDEACIQFYTSGRSSENYYIYSAEIIQNDSVVKKEVCYLDYSDYQSETLVGKSVVLRETAQAEKIILCLKRITRANYDYQISLNAANTANQSSITTPVPLKGNLKGALGIFTCYTEDRKTINNVAETTVMQKNKQTL